MPNHVYLQPALRRLVSDRIAAVALTGTQREAQRRVMSRVERSEYAEIPHPCLCGSIDEIVVAFKDRHDIAFHVHNGYSFGRTLGGQ